MPLTVPQRATLKTSIEADAAFNGLPHNSDGAVAIAAAYNLEASPAFVVWRNSVTRNELQQLDAFDWTRVDNLSVSKSRIWEWMFMGNAAIDPSKANVRAGIVQCWAGTATAADIAVGTAVLNACKRNATRFEKLFAVGTGSSASPATAAVIGSLDYNDVIAAMSW